MTMNKPHKGLLDQLLSAEARPIQENLELGIQHWGILPPLDSNAPLMVLEFSILEKTTPTKKQIVSEIDRYHKTCQIPVPKIAPHQHLYVYWVTISKKYRSKSVQRSYILLDRDNPIWLKMALEWTLLDWYIEAWERFQNE